MMILGEMMMMSFSPQNRSFAEGADACISLRLTMIVITIIIITIIVIIFIIIIIPIYLMQTKFLLVFIAIIATLISSGLGKLAPNMLLMGFKVLK